jgi:D-amino-acid dehydrogenase
MGSITRLSPAEAQKAFPPLRKNLGAVHVEGGARVDGRRMTAALLRAAQHLGATFLHGEAQFTRSGTVTLNGTALQADTTILTAGAWADSILRPIGTRLPVEPQRGQIIHFQLPTQDTKDWPVILPPGSHYIVPFDDGRIVAGATRETGAGFDYRTTATGQHEVLTEALSIAPGLGQATILETRIGFRPASTGIRPFLGWVPSAENLLIGNGLGAAGLTIGPFAGRLLAEMALQRTPSIDPAPFSLTTRREATPAVALR